MSDRQPMSAPASSRARTCPTRTRDPLDVINLSPSDSSADLCFVNEPKNDATLDQIARGLRGGALSERATELDLGTDCDGINATHEAGSSKVVGPSNEEGPICKSGSGESS